MGERFPKHPPKSQMERVFWGDQQSRTSTYLLIGTGPPSRIRDGGPETDPRRTRDGPETDPRRIRDGPETDPRRIRDGSETEGFITSRIPFVNMIGTGLNMGYMKPQLLEHKLNQTVLIPGTPKIGVPTFFSFFNQKFFTSKNFSYVCDPDKRIRQ